VVPLAVGIYRYKALRPPARFLFYYLVFGGLTDAVATYTAHHRMNNLWLLHTYTAVETVMLLWFYRLILREAWIRRVIPFLIIVFPLFCMANILWWQSLKHFNTYTRPVEALLLMYLGVTYFFETSHAAVDARDGSRVGLSWMNTGLLLYFSLSFFIFIFSNYLVQGQAFNTVIQNLHATFELLMYMLCAVGFYKCRR
jgi:hypothetical protein